jgi:hypothetical protein
MELSAGASQPVSIPQQPSPGHQIEHPRRRSLRNREYMFPFSPSRYLCKGNGPAFDARHCRQPVQRRLVPHHAAKLGLMLRNKKLLSQSRMGPVRDEMNDSRTPGPRLKFQQQPSRDSLQRSRSPSHTQRMPVTAQARMEPSRSGHASTLPMRPRTSVARPQRAVAL